MEFVKYEKMQKIGLLKISKPQALNALNTAVLNELNQCLLQIEKDSTLSVLIITGEGEKAFVAGADIKEINGFNAPSAFDFAELGQNVFMRIEKLQIPVIAAVNGFALGGGLELALSCDFIFASQNARMGLPECSLGLMPGFGGSVRLARRVSPGLAKQLTYTGEMISADDALRVGLVNKVYSSSELMAETLKVAELISERAPLALAAVKKTIETTYGMPTEKAMQVEREHFSKLFQSADCKEGTLAFIEKRKPVFKGQ